MQKFDRKTTKNLQWSLAKSEREREREREKFEKVFESVKTMFLKKLESRCSIDQKTSSINRTRQRLTEFFKNDFD